MPSFEPSLPATIFLIGMPGCGKSSVGKVLAEQLNYAFLDLDTLLDEQEGSTVGQIFEQHGQAYFREAEARALRRVPEKKGGVVLATGGGAPCFHENMAFMGQSGIPVYLKVSAEALVNRLTAVDLQVRPLLRDKTTDELRDYLAQTLAQREKFYGQAPLVVEVDRQSVTGAAEAIAHKLRQFSSAS